MNATVEDLQLMRDGALAWVTETAALSARRDDSAAACAQRWHSIAEMGWPAAVIAEAHGGAGLGFTGLGALLQVLGRELVGSPLLSSALVATAVQRAGSDEQCRLWLPRLAAGEAAAFALEESAHHRPTQFETRAQRVGGGWHLSGRKYFVDDAGQASIMLVVASIDGGIGLFMLDRSQVEIEALQRVDGRDCAHVGLDVVVPQAARLAGADDAGDVLSELLDLARIGLAAEMLGSSERALEITCDYLRTRKQFDQPIGGFQALQHRAAIMFVELELTRSSVAAALDALDAGDAPALAELACVAKAMANRTYHLISNEIVQMHGGIGMTSEHVAGLYLKRARVAEARYGSTSFLADRYAALKAY